MLLAGYTWDVHRSGQLAVPTVATIPTGHRPKKLSPIDPAAGITGVLVARPRRLSRWMKNQPILSNLIPSSLIPSSLIRTIRIAVPSAKTSLLRVTRFLRPWLTLHRHRWWFAKRPLSSTRCSHRIRFCEATRYEDRPGFDSSV
jgi:hypothetical protein